ncbi:molybdate ABC transporter substrate-binding protein [Nostoc sp.]|uniref:molybdate ABC transporter substrate-binding protein n=1 Tax=Nostoc sp. TaxID=1180 RepID=UPI002FF89601
MKSLVKVLDKRLIRNVTGMIIPVILIFLFGRLQNLLLTSTQQPSTVTLTVSAGTGLRPVLEDVQKVYKHAASDLNINYNFAASGVLTRQIEQGARIDIFISASSENMNQLQRQGLLLEGTRQNLIKSRVALIASTSTNGISSFQDLTKPIVKKITIGEPRSVPLGMYAQEVFKYLGIFEQVKPKLVYTRSALEILNFVAIANVDVGIVHDTNVKASSQVKIVEIAPEASHSPVIYPVAILLKNYKNLMAAKSFVLFLFSKQAKVLYGKYGYTIMK